MAEKTPHHLVALSVYLVLITALVRLGMSLYIPALPRMGIDLGLSAQQLAYTMTTYLIGFAVASVLLGPLSDHWGRRILVQGGLLLFLLGSLMCGVTQGYGVLLAGRILQAAGGGAVMVATRAMTRDAFDDQQMIVVLGWIGAITGLVPVLAPLFGGLLTQGFGWRANFYVLSGATVAVALFANRWSRETLSRDHRLPFNFGGTLRAYGAMLVSSGFMVPLLPVMLCFALQGAYLVASPFIFIHLFKMTPVLFGATSMLLVSGLLGGRFICTVICKSRGHHAAFMAGSTLTFLGGLLFLFFILAKLLSVATILLASSLYCLGFGALLPIGMKAGLSAFPERVGASSALFGCLTLGATAAGSGALGALLTQTARDIHLLGTFTFASGCLILLSSLLSRRLL